MANHLRVDRRKITGRDLFLKARMLAEGVRVEVREAPTGFRPPMSVEEIEQRQDDEINVDLSNAEFCTVEMKQQAALLHVEECLGNLIVLDAAEIAAPIIPKATSPLTLTLTGTRATISESGEVIGRGAYHSSNAAQPWSGRRLSNGLPIESALCGTSPGIVNVLFNLSCYNHNSGQACRYCGLFANRVSEAVDVVPLRTLREYARVQAEAVEIMAGYGWRGVISFGGGALEPSIREEALDRLEAVVEPLHERLDAQVLRELHLVYNHYPPPDFGHFDRMRRMGIQSTSIDMEVVTPKAFKAICPGKHAYRPLEYWKEAQEAALAAGLVSATNIVAGIESKELLLAGVHERLSKGVFPVALQFVPTAGSAMSRVKSQSAEWIVDVAEKVARAYIRSAIDITGPFGRATAKSALRQWLPRPLRRWLSNARPEMGPQAMPMPVNCVAFDALVRQVHRIPGGRRVPLPNLGLTAAAVGC